MNSLRSLNFKRESFSIPLDRAFRGINVTFSSIPVPTALSNLQIGISYLLDDSFAKTLGDKKPAEALILVVTSGYRTFAINIMQDALLFDDDYGRLDGLWFGYLNFKIFDFIELDAKLEYYFTVAMGTWVSKTLHISCSNPKTRMAS